MLIKEIYRPINRPVHSITVKRNEADSIIKKYKLELSNNRGTGQSGIPFTSKSRKYQGIMKPSMGMTMTFAFSEFDGKQHMNVF